MPTALLATRKGVFVVSRSPGGAWTLDGPAHPGVNFSIVSHDPRDGSWYAAANHGHFGVKMQRSKDRGKTWEETPSPQYPKPPEGAVPETDGFGKPLPWNTQLIWAFEPGHASRPGELWAGTIPGGLFRSTDSGQTWNLVRSLWDDPRRKRWMGGGMDLPGIHTIAVDPRDGRHIVLAVSTGGVWETKDAGETWDLAGTGLRAEYLPPDQALDPISQDAHRFAACAADPDHCWVQHHNGIFHSTDGGKNWDEIHNAGPSTFGFAVAAHPTEPGTAWFVPAVKDELRIPKDGKLVVTRTRDGGKSFDVLSSGLPQEHAYDIVYRHSLEVAADGKTLLFGTTTGSVFVSDNAGDSWSAVSRHLPPVHAVRWVD